MIQSNVTFQDNVTFFGGSIFDGAKIHRDCAVRFVNQLFSGFVSPQNINPQDSRIDLKGDILSVGYVDLQVNGGGGVMLNDEPSLRSLKIIANAHLNLGATTILPTLISDVPHKVCAAIDAVCQAIQDKNTTIAGLHLEGPHLSIARQGAHNADYIRPMQEADLELLLNAAQKMPVLKVTIAPENVTLTQVRQMCQAGIIVSIGHSNADFDQCVPYFDAGATCTTHLFNAMSQLSNREPGVVGAALSKQNVWTGLIADGFHVHPQCMRLALMAKSSPQRLFLISDAMAVAGTDDCAFHLEDRRVKRENGRLTLEDGTLAGADLDLSAAIKFLTTQLDVRLQTALRAATSVPAAVIGRDHTLTSSAPKRLKDMIIISRDLSCATPVLHRLDHADSTAEKITSAS